MSFIVLTSFSSSYGLVYQAIDGTSPKMGVQVERPEYEFDTVYTEIKTCPVTGYVTFFFWENIDAGYFQVLDASTLYHLNSIEEVTGISCKAENLPCNNPYTPWKRYSIYGVIGYDFEDLAALNRTVTQGRNVVAEGECLVHESLIDEGSLMIGGVLSLSPRTSGPDRISPWEQQEKKVDLVIVGTFNDSIQDIKECNGESIVPHKQIKTSVNTNTFILYDVEYGPSEFIITSLDSALNISDVGLTQATLDIIDDVSPHMLAKNIVLSSGLRCWVNDGSSIHMAYMGGQFLGKGYPIFIPWLIVVLTVVMTMVSSMHGRRNEVAILTSIGFNPTDLLGIFLTESLIMGLISGGIGYLLGLGVYPLFSLLPNAPNVTMKVSAIWSIASIGVSLITVLIGAVISARWSTSLTPSQKRKYHLTEESKNFWGEWDIPLPINVRNEDIPAFLQFIENSLKNSSITYHVFNEEITSKGKAYNFTFNYSHSGSHVDHSFTKNIISITQKSSKESEVSIKSRGEYYGVEAAILYVRKILMKWSTMSDFKA